MAKAKVQKSETEQFVKVRNKLIITANKVSYEEECQWDAAQLKTLKADHKAKVALYEAEVQALIDSKEISEPSEADDRIGVLETDFMAEFPLISNPDNIKIERGVLYVNVVEHPFYKDISDFNKESEKSEEVTVASSNKEVSLADAEKILRYFNNCNRKLTPKRYNRYKGRMENGVFHINKALANKFELRDVWIDSNPLAPMAWFPNFELATGQHRICGQLLAKRVVSYTTLFGVSAELRSTMDEEAHTFKDELKMMSGASAQSVEYYVKAHKYLHIMSMENPMNPEEYEELAGKGKKLTKTSNLAKAVAITRNNYDELADCLSIFSLQNLEDVKITSEKAYLSRKKSFEEAVAKVVAKENEISEKRKAIDELNKEIMALKKNGDNTNATEKEIDHAALEAEISELVDDLGLFNENKDSEKLLCHKAECKYNADREKVNLDELDGIISICSHMAKLVEGSKLKNALMLDAILIASYMMLCKAGKEKEALAFVSQMYKTSDGSEITVDPADKAIAGLHKYAVALNDYIAECKKTATPYSDRHIYVMQATWAKIFVEHVIEHGIASELPELPILNGVAIVVVAPTQEEAAEVAEPTTEVKEENQLHVDADLADEIIQEGVLEGKSVEDIMKGLVSEGITSLTEADVTAAMKTFESEIEGLGESEEATS